MKQYVMFGALMVLTCHQQKVCGQTVDWFTGGNNGLNPGTSFLGNTDGVPINFRTNNLLRMRLNNTMSYTIGSYTLQPKNGAVGLSPNNTLWVNGPGPFSRLHLHDGTTSVLQSPYRPWMDNGISFTTNSDQMYIGHKVETGSDQTSAVIQWGDNDAPAAGPDVLKFLFMGGFTGGSFGVGGLNGRELGRFHPQGFLGLGDFQSVSLQPTERLDLLTGRLRIRALPTDPAANQLTKVLVVDDVNPFTGEFGVVKWRDISTIGGGGNACASGWSLNGNNAVTAFNGNPCPPQAVDRVGIGATFPLLGKLHVEHANTSSTGHVGVYTQVVGGSIATAFQSLTSGASSNRGVFAEVTGGNGTIGIIGGASGATVSNLGGQFHATNGQSAVGVEAFAQSATSSSIAVKAHGRNSLHPRGVNAFAELGTTTSTGVLTEGRHAETAYGIHASAALATVQNIAVYGSVSSAAPDPWAGWFVGKVMGTYGSWVPSDETLKQDIQPLGNAMAVIQALNPRSYSYRTEEFSQMSLPEGPQVGLLAQELAEVEPSLVTNAKQPAQYDEEGNLVSDQVEFRAINYTGLIPYLIGALQEQNARIDMLQEQLAACCANPTVPADAKAAGSEQETLQGDARSLLISPNPFNEATSLTYVLEREGRAQLLVNSADGKHLRSLFEGQRTAGEHRYEWSTADLTPGIYYVTLLFEGEPLVKKAVKVVR
jgi:hypothetical protein